MKFRNMFLKYYAQADDGTQGGGDGVATDTVEQNGGQDGDDQPGENNNSDEVKNDADDVETDDDGKSAEVVDEEEEFLFDGKPVSLPNSEDDDQEGDSELVKRLRSTIRDQKRVMKESTQASTQRKDIPANAPQKPQMGDEGIDWDPEKYQEAVDKWIEDSATFKQEQDRLEAKRQEFGKKFTDGQQRYQNDRAQALKRFPGYEKAEAAIADMPEPLQAGLMVVSQKPTAVVMALARNPDLRKQVEEAYNSDHITLGYLIRDIESRAGSAPKVKSQHNSAPEVKGQNGVVNVGQLEALRKKALETGDMTAYLAAKKRKQ